MITFRVSLLVALLSFVLTSCVTQKRLPESAFKSLFDGKTLNGWKLVEKHGPGYRVENGNIVCPDGGGGDLFTEKEYSDFILRVDFKISKGANNGIAFRSPMENGQIAYIGNEVQVIDDNRDLKPGQTCGSLYRVFFAKPGAPKPIGEWNSYEITARGRSIKVVLNGQTVVDGNINDVYDPETIRRHPGMFRDRGHIGFLGHGDRVEFRNVRIYEFPRFIRRPNTPPEGFKSLFNGRDLAGWRGLVADPIKREKMSIEEWAREQVKADALMRKNWKVENGTVTYAGKGFDNLCTEKQYEDFELLVDWKIGEPKADSGVYLRGFPQVQIWESNSGGYDHAHPGSGGLYNNKKSAGYPAKFADYYPGEWNQFRIIMTGDRTHVFLNNQLVVDNKRLENFWERDKPIAASGPIEFQAHTTQVPFRNIYIREIPRVPKVEKQNE